MCGFCNFWVCVCVGLLVIRVLVFTVFLYCLYCVFVLFCLCIFILICFVCTGVRTTYCHRVATEMQQVIIIIIIIIIIKSRNYIKTAIFGTAHILRKVLM